MCAETQTIISNKGQYSFGIFGNANTKIDLDAHPAGSVNANEALLVLLKLQNDALKNAGLINSSFKHL